MNEQEKAEIQAEIKAEAIEKEKADKEKARWLNYLSTSTILIALCATLSSYVGGNYSSRGMMSQIKASDQWAFYQSKSIKEYLYDIQLDNLQTDLVNAPPGTAYENIKQRISTYCQNVAKFKTDKEQIGTNARQLESVRDDCQKHSSAFGLAVVFLEVSILLSSIAALVKKKPIWYLSMIPGLRECKINCAI